MNCLHNLIGGLLQSLLRLSGGHLDGSRKAGHKISSANLDVILLRRREAAADLDLDILCRTLAYQKVVFLAHVANQGIVKIISRNLDGRTDNSSPEGNHRNIRCSAADIHNHVSTRLGDINSCTDRRRNRLLNDVYLTGSRLEGCILYCLFLDLCHLAWYTDRDSRLSEGPLSDGLLDEILHHLLRDGIVRNNSLAERADCHNVAGRTSQHQACIFANCLDFICVAVECHNRRLLQNNAASPDVHQNARGAQINSNI